MLHIDKLILEFTWKDKGIRIDKTALKKKNEVEGITVPDLKTYYVATVITTVWYWHETHGSMEQNREPRNRCTLTHPTDVKTAKVIQCQKVSLFNT